MSPRDCNVPSIRPRVFGRSGHGYERYRDRLVVNGHKTSVDTTCNNHECLSVKRGRTCHPSRMKCRGNVNPSRYTDRDQLLYIHLHCTLLKCNSVTFPRRPGRLKRIGNDPTSQRHKVYHFGGNGLKDSLIYLVL